MTIEKTCPFCGKTTGIKVKEEDYIRWQMGALAQEAFPYLSSSEREVLISGMCFRCQDSVFGADDEGPEDEDITGAMFDLTVGDNDFWGLEICDDFGDPFDFENNCDCEEGFDPYCGCYTDDC